MSQFISIICDLAGKELLSSRPALITCIRGHKTKPRGWKKNDGAWVPAGCPLVYQNHLRFHPGLNVGLGKNLTLFAMESGKVRVTCEKLQPNWEHHWIKKFYVDRPGQSIYKKYFHVIPEPQTQKFNLVDSV